MALITSPCTSEELNLTVYISGHMRKSQLVRGAADPLLGFIVCAAVRRYWICSLLSRGLSLLLGLERNPAPLAAHGCLPCTSLCCCSTHLWCPGTNLNKGFRNPAHVRCVASENLLTKGHVCSAFAKATF